MAKARDQYNNARVLSSEALVRLRRDGSVTECAHGGIGRDGRKKDESLADPVRRHTPSWKRTLRQGVRQLLGVPEEESIQAFVEHGGARAFRSLERVLQGLGIAPPPRDESRTPSRSPASVAATDGALEHVERPEPTKFDLGQTVAREPVREHIPWGYGQNRVTAMPVDPDRLYVYWEVTDDAIADARRGLGAGGDGAWLSLRVYDITGRIFDGTNAHAYFDHRIERHERQWFFSLGKPGSTVCVEVGMKSIEGYFVRIARSSRVDMPRAGESSIGAVEWMTVKPVSGEIASSHVSTPPGGEAPVGGSPASPGAATGAAGDPGSASTRDASASAVAPNGATLNGAVLDDAGARAWLDGTTGAWSEARRQSAWVGDVEHTSWEAGPFRHEVTPPRHEVVEQRSGGRHVVESPRGRVVIDGPWSVTIRGIGAHVTRRVIGRWEIVRTLPLDATEHVQSVAAGVEEVVLGGSEQHVRRGASELRLGAASELRLGGASEEFFVGASELRLRGASERLYAGASELRWGGASERLYSGASELALRGASERMRRGASEERLGGASERWSGAGESVRGGASEHRLAASAPSSDAIERARASWQAFTEAGSRRAAAASSNETSLRVERPNDGAASGDARGDAPPRATRRE